MPIGMPAKILRQIPPEELDYSMDSDLQGVDPNQPAIDPSAPPADPYQFAVPSDYEREAYMDDVNAFLRSGPDPKELGHSAANAVRELKQPIDPNAEPKLPMSPAASGKKTDIDVSPEQELSERQLLRNYLQSLQVRRDNESQLMDMNRDAGQNSRVAMLAEGLSKAASKMGNLMGKPTGSTMEGFGKQAGAIEMGNVDEARKIMAESDPTAELARQAQIAQMMESIRASRAKTAQGEAAVTGKIQSDATRNAILAGKAGKGAASQKPTAEQSKLRQQEREYNERYAKIQTNLKSLSDMVRDKGTWELTGTHNSDLDRLNYKIAIDYAKIVDPESVAREGEVKAAQKYLLPITPSFEHGYTRTETALKLIRNFSQELEQDAKNRQKSMQSVYGVSSATGLGQEQAAPKQGGRVYIKALTGDNRVKAFTEEQAKQLLQQKQANGQPMYMRVK